MLTVYILHLHHAGHSYRRCVPTWMRQVFVYHVGPALGVHRRPVSRCQSSPTPVDQATLLSSWPCRTVNSADPEVATVSPGGYLPLSVRSVRESAVEHGGSKLTKRSGRETVHEDLITRHLRLAVDRHRAEQELEDIITEWRLVALTFDRLMFWILVVVTGLSTVFILVILPLTKPDIIT